MTENDGPIPVEGEAKGKRSKRLWWMLAAAAILVVLVVAFLPQFSTMQPAYYRRYPGMSARMDNWKNSTHARVGCTACHVEPGVKGLVSYGLASIPAFYSQILLGTQSTNLLKPPSVLACQKCHTNFRQVSPNGDLLIPHKAHVVVLKMNCVECHKDLVHSANEKGYNSPEMATCLAKCHDGKTATNQCIKCHTQKRTPESHAQKNWLAVHSEQAATGDCGKCHGWTQDYCADCHKDRPASHVGNWKTGHAAAAKQRGKGCLVCHGGEKFCKKCHD